MQRQSQKLFMLGLYAEFCKTTRIANAVSRADLCIKVCISSAMSFYAKFVCRLYTFFELISMKILCLYAYVHKLLCMAKLLLDMQSIHRYIKFVYIVGD
jgi:hypothetical protein